MSADLVKEKMQPVEIISAEEAENIMSRVTGDIGKIQELSEKVSKSEAASKAARAKVKKAKAKAEAAAEKADNLKEVKFGKKKAAIEELQATVRDIVPQIGDAVHAGPGGLAEYLDLVVHLRKGHQPDILRHIQVRAEARQLLVLILGLQPRHKVVLPQLRPPLHLCQMRLHAGQVAMHIVVHLEAPASAILAADAIAVRQLLGLHQVDVRSANSTLVRHDPFLLSVGAGLPAGSYGLDGFYGSLLNLPCWGYSRYGLAALSPSHGVDLIHQILGGHGAVEKLVDQPVFLGVPDVLGGLPLGVGVHHQRDLAVGAQLPHPVAQLQPLAEPPRRIARDLHDKDEGLIHLTQLHRVLRGLRADHVDIIF